MKSLLSGGYLLTILIVFSCNSSPSVDVQESLSGSWEVHSATRNGQPIDVLANVFFEFSESDFTTNFPVSRQHSEFTVPYELNKNTISYTLDDQPFSLNIEGLSDTLVLSTELMKYQFELALVRSSESESGQ